MNSSEPFNLITPAVISVLTVLLPTDINVAALIVFVVRRFDTLELVVLAPISNIEDPLPEYMIPSVILSANSPAFGRVIVLAARPDMDVRLI